MSYISDQQDVSDETEEAADILINMKKSSLIGLERLIRTDTRNLELLNKFCISILNNFILSEELMSSYVGKLLIDWCKHIKSELRDNQISYEDIGDKNQKFALYLGTYIYVFFFHCVIFDIKRGRSLDTENTKFIIETFNISLERFISLKYFPYLRNTSILKCSIIILKKYNFINDNLIVNLTKFTFYNNQISVEEKKEYTDILIKYSGNISYPERQINFIKRICNVFREREDCYQYGYIFTSGLRN